LSKSVAPKEKTGISTPAFSKRAEKKGRHRMALAKKKRRVGLTSISVRREDPKVLKGGSLEGSHQKSSAPLWVLKPKGGDKRMPVRKEGCAGADHAGEGGGKRGGPQSALYEDGRRF